MNPIIIENAKKALELDPNSASAHMVNGVIASAIEWNWEKAERENKKALELNPNYAWAHVFSAHSLAGHRRTEEATYHAKRAVELDPMNPLLLGMSAMALNIAGESQTALPQCKKAISMEPDQSFTYGVLSGSYLATGDTLKWYELHQERKTLSSWMEIDEKVLDSAFFEHGYIGLAKQIIKAREEIYSKGGMLNFCNTSHWYTVVGNYEKAMDYYEKGYETHDPCMIYIGVKGRYDKLKDNPRYIALLKKMNLPVD